MSRLDPKRLALLAGQNIRTADQVRRDPAVVKAAVEFRDDAVQVARSGVVFTREVRGSWLRHSR